ncbi:MAG: hypothetical protein GC145_00740 [Caulobacter sp.]|nr:hypothetical protein [Caulobacter sp.]
MRVKQLAIIGLAALALALPAAAQPGAAAFDPRREKAGIPGAPTQVLVLGTLHLGQTPRTFKADWLEPLLGRLQAWDPQVITIEGLSGEACAGLKAYEAVYAEAVADYCPRTLAMAALGQTATGLTMSAAWEKAAAMLADWPATPTPAQRRTLAATFAAAGEIDSALVQWLRLAPEERRVGDGLDAPLVEALNRLQTRKNENNLIAAELAARLGLERVYAVDDHSSDQIALSRPQVCNAEIQAVWARPDGPAFETLAKAEAELSDGESLLAYYRLLNSPTMQRAFIGADQLANMRTPSAAQCGRQYMAWWETRNLRMVANIRAAFGPTPGVRVLSVVGSSHKPYFDAYLEMIHEVRLVDAEEVLR